MLNVFSFGTVLFIFLRDLQYLQTERPVIKFYTEVGSAPRLNVIESLRHLAQPSTNFYPNLASIFTPVAGFDTVWSTDGQQGRIQGFVGFGRTPPPSETKKFFEAVFVWRG